MFQGNVKLKLEIEYLSFKINLYVSEEKLQAIWHNAADVCCRLGECMPHNALSQLSRGAEGSVARGGA